MRNLWTLVILLLFGVIALYLMGPGLVEAPLKRLSGPDADVEAALELNARGVQELAGGREREAVSTLRKAFRVMPGDPVIRRNLSVALSRYAMEDDHSETESLEILKESLDLWPSNPEGLDGMSTVHFRGARYADALDYASRLQGILPDRPDLDAYVQHLKERVSRAEGMVSEEGDRFRLMYSGMRKLEYEGEIIGILQTEMDALTAALGVFPEDPVDVLIMTGDLGERSDPLDPLVQGLYDGQIRLYVGDGIDDRENLVTTVRHEMVHALLHEVSTKLPGWVHEGLAQKVGEDPSPREISSARRYVAQALKKGYNVNMGSLDASFLTMEKEDRARAYATSLLFMEFLVDRFGDSFIPRFVSEIAVGQDSFRAVETVSGTSFERLQASFKRYLTEGG
jgi:hypothetical protein